MCLIWPILSTSSFFRIIVCLDLQTKRRSFGSCRILQHKFRSQVAYLLIWNVANNIINHTWKAVWYSWIEIKLICLYYTLFSRLLLEPIGSCIARYSSRTSLLYHPLVKCSKYSVSSLRDPGCCPLVVLVT